MENWGLRSTEPFYSERAHWTECAHFSFLLLPCWKRYVSVIFRKKLSSLEYHHFPNNLFSPFIQSWVILRTESLLCAMRSWLDTLGGPHTVRGAVTTGWRDAEVSKQAFRDRRWENGKKRRQREIRRKRERGSKRMGKIHFAQHGTFLVEPQVGGKKNFSRHHRVQMGYILPW